MTPPITIPLTLADRPALVALVARLWPAEAEAERVDPSRIGVAMGVAGTLNWYAKRIDMDRPDFDGSGPGRALDGLCDALEDHGLVVDGRRVVGWAATRIMGGRGEGKVNVRIIDIDGLDPRRQAHEDATTAARLARDAAAAGPVVADAKREHGIAAAQAARRAR